MKSKINRIIGLDKDCRIKKYSGFLIAIACCVIIAFACGLQGCGIYSFKDVSIPDSIKTVRINFLENRARYINPQLSPKLTDRLRQKIVSQTKLTQTNNDNAHYDISGYITDYSLSTSGVQNQREATNRLTVGVHITLNNRLSNTVQDYEISRGFDFSATLSLPQAEARLNDDIIRSITDDIFNRIFSNW